MLSLLFLQTNTHTHTLPHTHDLSHKPASFTCSRSHNNRHSQSGAVQQEDLYVLPSFWGLDWAGEGWLVGECGVHVCICVREFQSLAHVFPPNRNSSSDYIWSMLLLSLRICVRNVCDK